jgi:hypothetical protein
VAVQGDDWVNHLLPGDWAHKGLWHCIAVHKSIGLRPIFSKRHSEKGLAQAKFAICTAK